MIPSIDGPSVSQEGRALAIDPAEMRLDFSLRIPYHLPLFKNWAVSSAVEHCLHTAGFFVL